MCVADNLVLSLAILSLFAVCLFLDNTNVHVSINVRAPISRKVNAATVPRAHEWTTLFVPLYLAVSLSLSLSIYLSVITV